MVLSLKLFVASLIILPAIDYIWLSNMANFYVARYGDLARLENGQLKVLYFPAIVVYFLLALGLVFFVVPRSERLGQAVLSGALLGFVIYGVYDMTNMATLRNYTWTLSLVDMTWGTVLNAIAAIAIYLLRDKIA